MRTGAPAKVRRDFQSGCTLRGLVIVVVHMKQCRQLGLVYGNPAASGGFAAKGRFQVNENRRATVWRKIRIPSSRSVNATLRISAAAF